MTRARVRQEVRQMRFEALYERRQQRILTMAEAGEMLGVTERTFRRWSGRYHAEGAEGLQDRRIGRLSARAVPVDEALRMLKLYETRYTGWTVKHFHERWQTEHDGTRSYSWTKKTLQAAGHVTRATRRGAHRKKRPRTPYRHVSAGYLTDPLQRTRPASPDPVSDRQALLERVPFGQPPSLRPLRDRWPGVVR